MLAWIKDDESETWVIHLGGFKHVHVSKLPNKTWLLQSRFLDLEVYLPPLPDQEMLQRVEALLLERTNRFLAELVEIQKLLITNRSGE